MQDTNMDFDIANTWLFDDLEAMPDSLPDMAIGQYVLAD